MVKVTFKPWEEIVVHEVVRFDSLDKFIKQKFLGVTKGGIPAQALLWAEGIVFLRSNMPPMADVIKEQLLGRIHISSIEYAPMEKYVESISEGDVTVPVIDASNTEGLVEVAKALKKREKKR